ncbi:MAG: hypothetical protein ACWA5X_12385 [bacterium]
MATGTLTDRESLQLPPWANWLAMDADGRWWAYEHEPNLAEKSWYENEVGRSIPVMGQPCEIPWQESLHAVLT